MASASYDAQAQTFSLDAGEHYFWPAFHNCRLLSHVLTTDLHTQDSILSMTPGHSVPDCTVGL